MLSGLVRVRFKRPGLTACGPTASRSRLIPALKSEKSSVLFVVDPSLTVTFPCVSEPKTYVSLPPPPTSESVPEPAYNVSSPDPARMVSSPVPATRTSGRVF